MCVSGKSNFGQPGVEAVGVCGCSTSVRGKQRGGDNSSGGQTETRLHPFPSNSSGSPSSGTQKSTRKLVEHTYLRRSPHCIEGHAVNRKKLQSRTSNSDASETSTQVHLVQTARKKRNKQKKQRFRRRVSDTRPARHQHHYPPSASASRLSLVDINIHACLLLVSITSEQPDPPHISHATMQHASSLLDKIPSRPSAHSEQFLFDHEQQKQEISITRRKASDE